MRPSLHIWPEPSTSFVQACTQHIFISSKILLHSLTGIDLSDVCMKYVWYFVKCNILFVTSILQTCVNSFQFYILHYWEYRASTKHNLVIRLITGLDGSFMVDLLNYFLFQPVLHDWCNNGSGMCYHVYEMMHIKEPLLLIRKSSPCVSSWFPLSLSEWSFTIFVTPYNRK